MDLLIIVAIVVVLLFVFLGSGLWVAFALGLTGMLTFYWMAGGKEQILGLVTWNTTNSFVLTAVPMFIFMGEILLRSALSEWLYRGVSRWVGNFPGGLLHSNIFACAIFAAISGSSVATAASIGTVAIPEQVKRGYSIRHICGSLAAGGTLGILIPPSIPMIIYGSMVGESVGKLFIAGVIPGLILTGLFSIYVLLQSLINPSIAPRESATWKERFFSIGKMGPVILLVLLVLGTIYAGIATPTEAAALGATGSLILAGIYRNLNFKILKDALLNTTKTTSTILFIIVGAQILSLALSNLDVPSRLIKFTLSLPVGPVVILLAIYLLYYILGCFFDGISMMVMTLPVIYPVMTALGYNSIWFGIILVVLIEVGLITPPVGLNLYIIQGIAKGYAAEETIIGSLPYVVLMTIGIALFTIFPSIVLWLPARMF